MFPEKSAKSWCQRAFPHIKPSLGNDVPLAIELAHDDLPIAEELAAGLLIMYAVDEGDRFTFLANRHLSAEGVDVQTLHQYAMANLREYVATRTRVEKLGERFGVFLDGNLEASLMLVDEMWETWVANHIPHGVVVTVAARDVLAFCDAQSESGIAQLRGVIERVFPNGDHLISESLYTREDGRWRLYEL